MKKIKTILLSLLFIGGIVLCANAQDSTPTPTPVTTQTDNAGPDGSELAGSVVAILKIFGVDINPLLAMAITGIGGFVIDWFRRRKLKRNIAGQLKTINEVHPIGEQSAAHRNALGRLVDRLEGKKKGS